MTLYLLILQILSKFLFSDKDEKDNSMKHVGNNNITPTKRMDWKVRLLYVLLWAKSTNAVTSSPIGPQLISVFLLAHRSTAVIDTKCEPIKVEVILYISLIISKH